MNQKIVSAKFTTMENIDQIALCEQSVLNEDLVKKV